jgi:uncharacterized protein
LTASPRLRAGDEAVSCGVGLLPSAFTVASPETGTDYRITVATPDPGPHPGPWRVMIVLDADDHFDAALDAYRGLWARGLGRPWLLVGVGYGAGYKQPGNHRIRDYTNRQMDWEPGSGGGEEFLRFLIQTLWPRLEQMYPVNAHDPAIAGHSLGGLFVLNALFREHAFFRRGLAIAPSLWWDERATLDMLAEWARESPHLPARLFVGVGESDTESMRRDCQALQAQLRDRPFEGLRVTFEWFSGRGHFNVVPIAYAAGLRALVEQTPGWEPPAIGG